MIDIYFYRYDKRYNIISKSLGNPEKILSGEFRDAVNIINPQIVIDVSEYEQGDKMFLLKMNYVYIPFLKRYYFITNVELTRKNLVTFTLHVDVLMSHYNTLRYSHGYTARNEYLHDTDAIDERQILLNTFSRSVIGFDTTGTTVNTFFNSSMTPENYNIVVICGDDYGNDTREIIANRTITTGNRSVTIPSRNGTKTISGNVFTTPLKTEVVNNDGITYIIAELYTNDNIVSYVDSITVYPFTVETGTWGVVKIGDTVIKDLNGGNIGGYNLPYVISTPKIVADFVLNDELLQITNFNHLPPYAFYQLYIPFYGMFELDIKHLRNKHLILYYIVNYYSTETTVYLYNQSDDEMLLTSSVTLGSKLSFNTTNLKEVTDKQRTILLNSFLNVIGGTIAVAGGVVSGNPLAVGGGALAIGKTIGNAVTSSITNYKRAQLSNNDDITTLANPLHPYIVKLYQHVKYTPDTDFKHENGLISHRYYDSIESGRINGYTEFASLDVVLDANITGDYRPLAPTTEEINEFIDLFKKGVYFPPLS